MGWTAPCHRQLPRQGRAITCDINFLHQWIGAVGWVRTVRLLDRLYFQAERIRMPPVLVDARDSRVLGAIDEATAREVARRDFSGDGRVTAAALISAGSIEDRGELPVWQVRFDDAGDTTIDVSPVNGGSAWTSIIHC